MTEFVFLSELSQSCKLVSFRISITLCVLMCAKDDISLSCQDVRTRSKKRETPFRWTNCDIPHEHPKSLF